MRLPRRIALTGVLVLLVASLAIARGHGHRNGPAPGKFDYWLMSLSWSPSYCESHPNDDRQCRRKAGYGFVLHGLWPQSRGGYGPQDCATFAKPGDAVIQRALAFMPSRHLIEHEWQAHGACSGMDPDDYFAAADRAFSAVTVPPVLSRPRSPPRLSADEIVAAFRTANPGLRSDMLSVICHDGGELTEVRVCLDRGTLAPRACGGRVRNTCRAGTLRIPAAR
jgi:ribonuclease T2